MRWLWIPALVLALSACAVPPAVSIATLAVDAGSYLISGKTVYDHGLSVALDQDCAMLRVFEGSICEDEQDYEVAVAALEPLPDGGGDLDIAVAAGPGPEAQGKPRPSDHWSLAYRVQLAGDTDRIAPLSGGYLASEFIFLQP